MNIHLPASIANKAAVLSAKVAKHAPTAAVVVGTGAVVAGAVLACRATLKVDGIMAEHEQSSANISDMEARDIAEYTEGDARNDRRILKLKTAGKLVKNYAIPAGLVIGGTALILYSHKLMSDRVVQLSAAAELANISSSAIRQRLKERLGEEKAAEFLAAKVEKDENDLSHISVVDAYGATFDYMNPNYTGAEEVDRNFLQCQERWANDILTSRGHMFLNEVYDMLGLPHTPAGAVCGWLKHGTGDGYIDFGEFAGQYEEVIIDGRKVYYICPNVDGVIYDKI